MAVPTAGISAVITIAVLSWLFRLARKPVPVLPDGSVLVRYGTWMVVVGVACGVVLPLALVAVAVTAGVRNPEDPSYFGGEGGVFRPFGRGGGCERLKGPAGLSESGLGAGPPGGG